MNDNDTPDLICSEIKQLESDIIITGLSIKTLGEREAEAIADYEGRKNELLISLYAEEAENKTKRTEAQRVAIYRNAYKRERLEKNLASNALKAERDYLSALQSVLMAKQSRLRTLEAERQFQK